MTEDEAISCLSNTARRQAIRTLVEAGEGASISADQCWPEEMSSTIRRQHLRILEAVVEAKRRGAMPSLYRLKPGCYAPLKRIFESIDQLSALERRITEPAKVELVREVNLLDLLAGLGFEPEPIPLGVRVGEVEVSQGGEPGWLTLRTPERTCEVREEDLQSHLTSLLG